MKEKIPTPPVRKQLYVSISFWSQLLTILDKKIQNFCEHNGYGNVGVTIYIQNGHIKQVKFIDELSDQDLR